MRRLVARPTPLPSWSPPPRVNISKISVVSGSPRPRSATAKVQPTSSRVADTRTIGGRPSWSFDALAMRFWKTRDSAMRPGPDGGQRVHLDRGRRAHDAEPEREHGVLPHAVDKAPAVVGVEHDLGGLGLARPDHKPHAGEPLAAGVGVAELEVDDRTARIPDGPMDADRVGQRVEGRGDH